MTSKHRTALRVGLPLILAVASAPAVAADASTDVQRQLLQREQQQMELRLKMQQQIDRSTRQPLSPSADFNMRQLDRDQQQRLQQFNDLQTRGLIAPGALGPPASGEQMRRDLERGRAAGVGPGGLGLGSSQASPFSGGRPVETPSAASGP